MTRVAPADLKGNRSKIYTVIPDRKTAIETAVSVADPADIILIAGKGHEDYQIIGTERRSFDDRLMAKKALAAYHARGNP
jgi:UDP-N-acetylmuramoyl-L-alanyl-D-glutamate--2,6-diaminopimelate ligase